MSRFVYKKRTPEQFRTAANRRGGGFDSYIKRDFKTYKMRDGKNVVRFLPPTWEDADHFAYDIYINYDVGPDKTRYLSLSRMGKGKDPLAEARNEAMRAGDTELAKALNPSRSLMAWVIDRFDATAEAEGPQILVFPGKLNTSILTASEDEDTKEIIYVDDPDEGADVRFYKEGQGKTGTNYPGEKVKVLKPGPLSEDAAEADAWLEYIEKHPIPECLQFYPYEHISAMFNGAGKAPDEEDDDGKTDNQPPNRAAKTAPWEDDKEPKEERQVAAKTAKPEPSDDDSGSIRDRIRRRRESLQD